MIKYCDEANRDLRFADKWNLNKETLREHLKEDKAIVTCDSCAGNDRYKCPDNISSLVELTVRYILGDEWDAENIFVVDDERRGTLVFLIPRKSQPSEDDYLMTFWTSSSSEYSDMDVCECLMTNMIRPYKLFGQTTLLGCYIAIREHLQGVKDCADNG